ncbi:DUF7009 family protein [Chitinophaga nivalis]|uniref:PilZ domain-containing protein n=1 Tax=Chitinophaga nivalis TaxID=2991709 RepID=A0ABT3ITY0_9BACT|nr:hypothetical protein [Chitinophaga nivalis]MCW3462885.1 hypothetical protein [Chitinophaga nivalis]MCW3487425.1 hypothetical protein [Chitinophaga nivalis]
MKIRLRDNSIRYRLDKTDIEQLQATGKTTSDTKIGTGALHFCIRGKTVTAPLIKMEPDGIHLVLPLSQLDAWYVPDQVGFELVFPNPDGSQLKVLVEKDFKCLSPREEDDSQAFDNPMNGKNC